MAIDEQAYLARIGGGLLRHIVMFGSIGPLTPGEPGHLELATCIALTRAFLIEAERLGAFADCPPDLPFISNRSIWDENIPVGGYIKDHTSLPRSTLIRSYDLIWSLQAERHSAKGPVLRAMTWMCSTQGLPAAVRYLFDLQRWGFLSGVSTLREILDLLIRLRSLVPADRDFAAVIFPETPQTNRQWLEMPFRESFNAGDVEPPVQDKVGAADCVLQEAFETVRRCREAATYDEWLVRQLNQAPILSVAMDIFRRFTPQPGIQIRALLDMIEEIMADAVSFGTTRVGGPLLQPSFGVAQHVSREIAKLDRHGWKRRVMEERLVLPMALRHLIDRADWLEAVGPLKHPRELAADLPLAWRGVSPEAAYPIYLSLRGREPSPWMPLTFYAPDDEDQVADGPIDPAVENEKARSYWDAGVHEIENSRETAIALESAGQLEAALDIYRRILDRYPWCHVLRDRAAHVRQLQGDVEGALNEVCAAVLSNPLEMDHWRCLAGIARSAGFHSTAALAERQVRIVTDGLR